MGVFKYISYVYHVKSFTISVLIVRGDANAHTLCTLSLHVFFFIIFFSVSLIDFHSIVTQFIIYVYILWIRL